MFRAAVLILSFVRLLLVEGIEPSNPVENEAEILSNSTKRILFGTQARPKDFPYLVGLRLDEKKSLCGGSIIASHWVLTAAHCMRGESCSTMKIYPTAWPNRQTVMPSACYIHELNRPAEYEYDIGLLQVDSDLLAGGRAKVIDLPPPGMMYPSGTPIIIAGWGATEEKKYPRGLLRATVPILDWDTCNKEYLDNHDPGTRDMPIRTVCMQGEGPTAPGTCLGDSGGPAVTPDNVLIGVASFVLQSTDNFCLFGGPSMFVSVVDYLPWIYQYVDPSRDTSGYPVRPEHILP